MHACALFLQIAHNEQRFIQICDLSHRQYPAGIIIESEDRHKIVGKSDEIPHVVFIYVNSATIYTRSLFRYLERVILLWAPIKLLHCDS